MPLKLRTCECLGFKYSFRNDWTEMMMKLAKANYLCEHPLMRLGNIYEYLKT